MKRLFFIIALLHVFTLQAQVWKADTISDALMRRMEGKSWPKTCTMARKDLRYLRVLHYGTDGKTHEGELVCNRLIADDLIEIFRKLYEAKYVIERMELVDNYDAVDERSMAANNTSCFNFRFVSGTKTVSKHGQGRAIDVNPLYNPCYNTRNGKVEPLAGKRYATNRTKKLSAMVIDRNDLCYRLFIQHGFRWGGAWKNKKDYQHFEK